MNKPERDLLLEFINSGNIESNLEQTNTEYYEFLYDKQKAENTDLKQELEARERMIEERNRIIRSQVGWVDEARKERDGLKRELEVHKKALMLLCVDVEEIMDCPKNYPAFEEFLVNLNCKDCKDHDIFSDCWEKVYLAQARKELSK